MLNKVRDYTNRSLLTPALFVVACMLTAPVVCAQEMESAQTQGAKTEIVQVKSVKSNEATAKPLQPKWADYKGIRIGMRADEVRAKLDNLKVKGKIQDFFVFSDTETAQVFYDDQGKVQAISVNYVNAESAPDAVAVLGEEVLAKEDGSMHKLVRYPDAGFWVAYSLTAGDAPLITVTIQKMR